MRAQIILLGLLLSLSVYAQFLEPKNFGFTYNYIRQGENATCGEWKDGDPIDINGQDYCSYFEWNSPDTSLTTSHLDGYRVYYYNLFDDSITVLKTLTDTSFYKLVGIVGEVWVTAIYSNPAGESSKSNIIINEDLPINLNKTELISEQSVLYDTNTQSITLKNADNTQFVSIIDANGKFIRTINYSKVIDVSDLNPGLYFVEFNDIELNISRFKFIKK